MTFMTFIMNALSAILWLCAIMLSGATGMAIENKDHEASEKGVSLVLCFAVCALILQVMA